MKTKHKGAWSELRATSYLLENGYEVFRNVSYYGPVDIVAYDTKRKDMLLIDVKSAIKSKHGYLSYGRLSKQQEELGVCILLVFEDGTTGFERDLVLTTTSVKTRNGMPLTARRLA